ncbi:MAG TPA: hypothetical protein ENJ95_02850, partial [Bacteroidetes bacterium]|nr:hypothetical protein [Bacteroidota bacterium]
YYAYLLLHLGNEKEEAWRIVNASNLDAKNDPIACFIKANLAMRTDNGDEAISILENRPQGEEFHPFYYLDYMTGIAKLQRLDYDAPQYLLNYVNNFKGRNFIKDAYQKLAWSELLRGNEKGYHTYMERCKSNGYTVVESDQSANNAAKRGEVPDVGLLKARLLFDGGRFQRAFDILKDKKESDFEPEKNKLELNYRLGRLTHLLGQYGAALDYYQKTIDKGRGKPWYFACRAALEKGHIYEKTEQKKLAVAAFKECLDISPDEHKQGLHQQAKAGLRRLKN